MNTGSIVAYDHAPKAGNKGDVWKHFILLSIVKEITLTSHYLFYYFESHCGNESYILPPHGEWQEGIGSLWHADGRLADHPYIRIQGTSGGPGSHYHGSWSLVAKYLRRNWKPFFFTLCDISDTVRYDVLTYKVSREEYIEFRHVDGFSEIKTLHKIPHLIFIDPPYHPPDSNQDWISCLEIIDLLSAREASFLVWYPVFDETKPQSLVNRSGHRALEVIWDETTAGTGMKGAGMLVANCEASVTDEVRQELTLLAQILGGRYHIREVRENV